MGLSWCQRFEVVALDTVGTPHLVHLCVRFLCVRFLLFDSLKQYENLAIFDAKVRLLAGSHTPPWSGPRCGPLEGSKRIFGSKIVAQECYVNMTKGSTFESVVSPTLRLTW